KETPKNEKWISQAEKRLKLVKEQEEKVWKSAWVAQEEMFSWPSTLDKRFKEDYFVKSLTIQGPVDPKDKEKPPPDVEKGCSGVFHGVLVDAGTDGGTDDRGEFIRVRGLNKGAKERTFYKPSENAKVVADGKGDKKSWTAELQNYKNHKVV